MPFSFDSSLGGMVNFGALNLSPTMPNPMLSGGFGINNNQDYWGSFYQNNTSTTFQTNGSFGTWSRPNQTFGSDAKTTKNSPSSSGMSSAAKQVAGIAISSGLAAVSTMLSMRGAARQYNAQARGYENQAAVARANQRVAKLNIVSAYQTGEYRAMLKGLENAQIISSTRVSTAARGVQLNSGSSAEIEATQRTNALRDKLAIDRETMENAINAQRQLVNAQMAENTALGNAAAARELAKGNSGFNMLATGLMSFASSWAMSDLSYQMMSGGAGYSPTGTFFGFGG